MLRKAHDRALGVKLFYDLLLYSDVCIVRLGDVFRSDYERHYFGGRRRIHLLIGFLFINYRLGIEVFKVYGLRYRVNIAVEIHRPDGEQIRRGGS